MEFINYDTCDKLIRKSVKGITIEKNPSNKEVLKHKSTRYLLHQHWVLVVLPIKKIVIYFRKGLVSYIIQAYS